MISMAVIFARRAPPAFTQDLSRYIFEHGFTEDGESLLGIRYLSRLSDDIENWAIFEGSEPYDMVSDDITRDDPDLVAASAVSTTRRLSGSRGGGCFGRMRARRQSADR
jgi:hypothetical protein